MTDNDLVLSGCEADVEVLFHATWSQSYSIAYEVSSTLIASPEFYAVNYATGALPTVFTAAGASSTTLTLSTSPEYCADAMQF